MKLLQNKILIIGCGRLGATIANDRSKKGENVIVVDSNKDAFIRLDETFSGITFCGDATDLATLEDAYIKTAKEVVLATGDDNVNIFVAHVCREVYDIPKIIVRLDDPTRGVLFEGKRIKGIYPLELSVSKFNIINGD